MRNIGLFTAWLVATAVAVFIASAAVGAVRGEVTDQPQTAEPFIRQAPVVDTTTTSSPNPSSTTSTVTDSSTSTSTTTTTAPGNSTTTTITGAPPTTTAPTSPGSTTTTAPTESPTRLPPYQLIGGTVTIEVLEPNVWLIAAVPSVGFTADVEHAGPGRVEVEFESVDAESKFRASWEGGQLVVDIDEE